MDRHRSGASVLWLVVLLAAVASIMTYRALAVRVDSRLKVVVREQLGKMFPLTHIAIDRVSVESANCIAVHGLHAVIKDGKHSQQVLSIDRVLLTGDIDLTHLMQESVRVRQIEFFRPQLELWQTQAGLWSIQALAMRPAGNVTPPSLRIHGGQLRIHQDIRSGQAPVVIHDIHGDLAAITPKMDPVGGSTVQGCWINGKLFGQSGGVCEQIEVVARGDVAQGIWHFSGNVRELDFSADFFSKLPKSLATSLSQISGLSCKATARFAIDRPSSAEGWKFRIQGDLSDGRLNDSRLPYPLEQVRGDFFCDNQSLQLRGVQARSGQASFKLDTDIKGFHPQAPVVIQAEATGLQLDDRVYNALPAKWRTYWDRVRPEGYVDAKVFLISDGTSWRPTLTVACRDVNLECWLFPYPLTDVVGQVIIESERLLGSNLRGKAGGQTIVGGFNLQRVQEEWFGKLSLKVDGLVAIDEKILSALTVRNQNTSNTERFVRSLEPTGGFQLRKASFERRMNEPGIWHKELDILVYDCSMLYQNFRYPLHRIHGRIVANDDHWQLEGFEGWNDSGRIQCNGEWIDGRDSGIPFRLAFTAFSLPMEDELQQALPVDARQLWDQLRPSGSIDRADVSVVRSAESGKVDVQVRLHEDNITNADTGQSLRLHPKAFPYWLSDVACDLTYQPGKLDITEASATNTNSRMALRAQCQQNASGNWVGAVQWLPSSRIIVDTQLLRALPESISAGLVELDLRGPVNVMGETRFLLPVDSSAALTTDMNMQLDLEDVQLGEGKYVDGIRGTLWMSVHRDPSQLTAAGWAQIDAMSVKGVPVTHVRGPFSLMGNQVFFGSDVAGHFDPATGLNVSEVTADAFSGSLTLSGSGQLDSGRFQVASKLANADLRCLLQDLGGSEAPTDARCQMGLTLAGIPWEPQTYSGSGVIHLSDAQLYQLPTMIQLLRKLAIAPTDKAAFHTADISFTIDGDRIPLKLACEGDLLSLRGTGWTNFRRELDLEVYSYVGGRVPISSVLTPLISESRYATFMSLEIDGTLDNPRVERRAFPQLAVLQQIFPDKVTGEQPSRPLLDRWMGRSEGAEQTADTRAASDLPVFR